MANPYFDEDGLSGSDVLLDADDSWGVSSPVPSPVPPVVPVSGLPLWAQIRAEPLNSYELDPVPVVFNPPPLTPRTVPVSVIPAPPVPAVAGTPMVPPLPLRPGTRPSPVSVPVEVVPAVLVPSVSSVSEPVSSVVSELVEDQSRPDLYRLTPVAPTTEVAPVVGSAFGRAKSSLSAWQSKGTGGGQSQLRVNAAGGRGKVLALRVVVWGVMGVIVLNGITHLAPSTVSVDAIASQVKSALGENGFPLESGQLVASRFARAYLTFNAADKGGRVAALTTYLTPGDNTFLNTSGNSAGFTQNVIDGPYMVGKPRLVDKTHAVFTLAVEVATAATYTAAADGSIVEPVWLYVAVPVVADSHGAVAVAGAPAFVGAPTIAGKTSALSFAPDTTATTGATPFLVQFFGDWVKATPANQIGTQYLVATSSNAARDGLGGPFVLSGTPTVAVSSADPVTKVRTAEVTVSWATPGGLIFTQTYEVKLSNIDQRWAVLDISGGSFTG